MPTLAMSSVPMFRVFSVYSVLLQGSIILAQWPALSAVNVSGVEFSSRAIGRAFALCVGSNESTLLCLGEQVSHMLDLAAQDNSTWHFGDYLRFEKELSAGTAADEQRMEKLIEQRSMGDRIGAKLLHLAQDRALRLRLPRASIANAIKDADGFDVEQGRKKKDKDKNMAMMGGMIMMATVAQMFLGKVLLIAGSAFVMAKIALLISLLSSLKKGSPGSSSGSTDHVIVSSSGGGHSHESGWHRSLPHDYRPTQHAEYHGAAAAHDAHKLSHLSPEAYASELSYYEGSDNGHDRRAEADLQQKKATAAGLF